MSTPASDDFLQPRRSWGASILLWVGSLGPLGHLPASGTAAVAIAGIPLCWLMHRYLGPYAYLAVTVVFTGAAMAIHHHGDRLLGESDSRLLVWDELAGYFFAMLWVPFTWKAAILGFFVERALDIFKLPPASHVDKHWHNGVGVVLDDVIAGLYTCIILHFFLHFAPGVLQ